ncbi:hypothetical protein [Pseudomonas lini]
MNKSQMEIRSNTLFTSNEFHSSFVVLGFCGDDPQSVVSGSQQIMAPIQKHEIKKPLHS